MNPATNLWSQLLADIDDPNLMWQLLALAVCAALGTAFLFMQKIALAIAVAGPDVFSSFTNQLAIARESVVRCSGS